LSRANFLKDEAAKETSGTKPVGSYAPNAFGLFDVTGNAWEWVADWYQPDYYKRSPAVDPPGPPSGAMRIVRGGAWLDPDPNVLDLSHRHEVPADTYSYSIGFRIAIGP
jgi:formylglycine-generating enzyme required for sulfatase activity